MKYVTIEQWISYGGSKITHAQVITKDGDSFTVKSEVMDMDDLAAYYENRSPDDIFEYRIESGNMLVSDVSTAKVKIPKELPIEKIAYYQKPLESSIYHLFQRLMNDNAFLVAPEGIDNLDNIEDYIIEFIPKYSLSTMSVYIPIPVNLYWKSIKLIYAEGSQLKTNSFLFRIPKVKSDKYDYEFVAEMSLAKQDYVIMRYNGENSLYVYDPTKVRLFESLLNRYVFRSAQLKNMLNAISFLKRLRCKEMKTVEYKHSSKTKTMSVTQDRNISFECTVKDVTKNELMAICDDLVLGYKSLVESGASEQELRKHILDATRGIFDYTVYHLLIDIYNKTDGLRDVALVFNLCKEALDHYGKMKAEVDAFIYAYRVNYFSFNTMFLKDGYIFSGGGVPSKTRFRRMMEG